MIRRTFLAVIMAIAFVPAAATAQSSGPWQAPASSDKLVGELKALVDKGARENLARRSYIDDLRALVARYDWAWTRLLLADAFADGNYTANPAWTVRSGKFEVTRDFGLLSTQSLPKQSSSAAPGQSQGNVGQQLLGAVLQQMIQPQGQQGGQQAAPAATRSDIYTPVATPNGFDLRIVLRSRNEEGRFEFGPYIAGEQDQGYRIVYTPGGEPSLAIVRYSAFGSGVVDTAQQAVTLDPNTNNNVQWLRWPSGEMAVYVNGKEVIRTQDRNFTKGFDGFIVSNLGGTHAVREITLYGTP